MNIDIQDLQQIAKEKHFNTRGLPFSKKMWRDGYNKALQDIINFTILLQQENTDHTGKS